MAETSEINFSCLTSYSTSIQLGGLSALLLPVLKGAGHGLIILISRKTDSVRLSCAGKRLAVNGSNDMSWAGD